MKNEYRCSMCGCIVNGGDCILGNNPLGDICEECVEKTKFNIHFEFNLKFSVNNTPLSPVTPSQLMQLKYGILECLQNNSASEFSDFKLEMINMESEVI